MRLALGCAVLALTACSKEQSAAKSAPTRAFTKVAIQAVERLEAQVPALAPLSPAKAESIDQMRGLLGTMTSGDERTARLAHDEFKSLGDGVLAPLAAMLTAPDILPTERSKAVEQLGALDTRASAEVLLTRIQLSRTQVDNDGWMRAQCAWRLGSGTQDWTVPRLLLQLRYETDYETVTWVASTLAHFGNFAGLDGLFVISRDPKTTQELRDAAIATAARMASDVGVQDAATLFRVWNDGDPNNQLPNPELSPAHQLEVLRIVRGFSEWQLRGVDDGRFLLQRESRRIAPLIAPALFDENRYVRTHTAQVLERMGHRARETGADLLAALDDAETAPQVAMSLGAVGYAPAEPALIQRLGDTYPLELRVAAARSLGTLALPTSAPALDRLVDTKQPLDLRMAAACSRVHCSPADVPRPTLDLLLSHLKAADTDTAAPEIALDIWLTQRAASAPAVAANVLTDWRAASSDNPPQRVAKRAELLANQLGALCAN